MTATTEAQIYDHVLAELEADRWTRNEFADGLTGDDDDPSHCLLGMVGHAVANRGFDEIACSCATQTEILNFLNDFPEAKQAIARMGRIIKESGWWSDLAKAERFDDDTEFFSDAALCYTYNDLYLQAELNDRTSCVSETNYDRVYDEIDTRARERMIELVSKARAEC